LHFGCFLELPTCKHPKLLLCDANVVLSLANKVCVSVFVFEEYEDCKNIEVMGRSIGDLKI